MSNIIATWHPAPGLLFGLPETAENIAYSINCSITLQPSVPPVTPEPIPPSVTGYSATITPMPPLPTLVIFTSASGVTVSAQSLAGLFGLEFIEYRQGNQIKKVNAWEDLPADADIIEYRPSREKTRTYDIAVTAHLSDGTSTSANYQISIHQDWTAGRDLLQEAIHARRHP